MTQSVNYAYREILLQQDTPITILAVEDDIISMAFLEAQVINLGHRIRKAMDGKEALALLKQYHETIDVVLMDREMPVMDGLTTVRHIKQDPQLRHIPIIMVTGADSVKEMQQGLDAGVFYYLTKPVEESMLRSVVSAAVREAEQSRILAEELGKHRTSFNLIETCRFTFRKLEEAESLAAFMANCFPDSRRVLTGLGELLINAIEHGNLGIGYEAKSRLVDAGTWRAEIQRLQQLPEHMDKHATATIARKENGIYAIIEDMGNGFEWKRYMKIDPARAADNHGRGIAQANALSFDKLTYNEKGNQVIAFVNYEQKLDW